MAGTSAIQYPCLKSTEVRERASRNRVTGNPMLGETFSYSLIDLDQHEIFDTKEVVDMNCDDERSSTVLYSEGYMEGLAEGIDLICDLHAYLLDRNRLNEFASAMKSPAVLERLLSESKKC